MTLDKSLKKLQIVILAAGQGTRMKSPLPKPLVPILGAPLLSYVLDSIEKMEKITKFDVNIGVVVGHQKEQVEKFLSSRHQVYTTAWQREQLGTAHALKSYFEDNPKAWDSEYLGVVCGDTPLLNEDDLAQMMNRLDNEEQNGICATFEPDSPFGLGRIQRGENGFKIIEEKDATDLEREITEVNSGLYFFKTKYVKKYLKTIGSENKSNEFYLTDLFGFQRDVIAMKFSHPDNFLGINNLSQLSYAEEILQKKKLEMLMDNGVRLIRPQSIYIEWPVVVGEGTWIYPGVNLTGVTSIAKNCVIETGSFIKNSSISNDTKVLGNSYLEDSIIEENCSIGPFARIRPGSHLESSVKIGNFVETKKSILKKGSKVSHLSYVGDAEIGENANIGCGFITCNYDGANKHKTIIGAGTFVGSDCQMIAPVEIGKDSFIAAGSTITNNVPDGGFAIARGRQTTKEGMARKFLKTKKE